MTVATLNLEGRSYREFGLIRKSRRATLDAMELPNLKALDRALLYESKPGRVAERDYVRQNIAIIQVVRGII